MCNTCEYSFFLNRDQQTTPSTKTSSDCWGQIIKTKLDDDSVNIFIAFSFDDTETHGKCRSRYQVEHVIDLFKTPQNKNNFPCGQESVV